MVLENKSTEKICSFYVSDYHLELILIPYINEKLEKQENIKIITEKNLKETIEVLINKLNLKEENRNKILDLDWSNKDIKSIEENSNIVIIGAKKYIGEINKKLKNKNILNIVDCYDFNEVKDEMEEIIEKHNRSLNAFNLQEI